MSTDARFPIHPWEVREFGLNLGMLAHCESIFALSNGHIGIRGNLDEGDPSGMPGTYLNAFYETRALPYAESGYGYPESGQAIVNVTNGKLIRLLVDDDPFDVRYGQVLRHERILDLRAGVLRRVVEWASPSGQVVRVRSTRLVSFTRWAIVGIRYELQAVGTPARVVVHSELVANKHVPHSAADPRVAAALKQPLEAEEHSGNENRSCLIHRTRLSGLRVVAAVDHIIAGNGDADVRTHIEPDSARTTIGLRLEPGQRLVLTKYVAYGWSGRQSLPALRDQVDGALSEALAASWQGLIGEQRAYLAEFWDGADVELDGDEAVQQAVRFGLFHVLQASARAEQRAIPAKGLTGPGYDGHAFWDTESFVLPVLTATAPHAAADALMWRRSTMELAIGRASALNLRGAAFPWRTIRGQECGAYWPVGTAAVHLNADIAVAAARHVQWTGDEDFERCRALPLLVCTARLWASLGYFGKDKKFHLDGVTGPDEYSALVNDNAYTNLMEARNLRYAADTAERWPVQGAELDVRADEIRHWRAASASMYLPYIKDRTMPEQHCGSTGSQRWDFAATAAADAYPLLLHAPYFEIYRKEVAKQADLVLAMHWCGESFTPHEKAVAFSYYEQITVRDSSLSACSQAVLAAETGHLELAHDYLREAALMDLHDLESNTRDGVHVASLAGAWIALVCGFGGLRGHGGELSFAPRLPDTLSKLSFAIRWRGCKLRVHLTPGRVRYSVEHAEHRHIELLHHGQRITVSPASPVELDIPAMVPLTDRPVQPAGRAPLRADVGLGLMGSQPSRWPRRHRTQRARARPGGRRVLLRRG